MRKKYIPLEKVLSVVNLSSTDVIMDVGGGDYPAIGTDFLGIPSTLKGLHSIRDLNALGDRLGEKADDVFWNNYSRVLNAILE